jgi:hypothetical protein
MTMDSTRKDGRPTPDPDNYRLLIALTWVAAFLVEIFGTAVLTGIHQADDDRAGYWPSWTWCCVLEGTGVLVFYSALSGAYRSGGRAVVRAERLQRKRRREAEAELVAEERRVRLFGRRRLPIALTLSPMLWALPLIFAGTESLPADPDTGQKGGDPANITLGLVLPIVVLLLWTLTGWLLTAFAVAVWLGWAACTASWHLTAADAVGFPGLGMMVIAVPVMVAKRRRTVAREEAAEGASRVMPSLTGPGPQERAPSRSRTTNNLVRAYRSLQAVMVLAFVGQEVFASITLYRLPHSSSSGLVLSGSLAVAAAVVFYAAAITVRYHSARMALLLSIDDSNEYLLRDQARQVEQRVDRFGPKQLPLVAAITPTLWTLPVWVGGLAYAVRDPATGQPGPNLFNMAVGAALAITAPWLWRRTNRALTVLGLVVWVGWAAWTLAGHPFAGAVVGGVGVLLVSATVRLAPRFRQRRLAQDA